MRVGADMTAFLLTGPEGHVLIDGASARADGDFRFHRSSVE